MSFGERNWHGIVRGQGYVRVLVGRARSDMLRDSPRLTQPLTPRLTPPKEFLYHPLPLWKSIICRIYWEEWTSWGRCWWKWLFSWSKTRFALMFLMNSARPRRKKKKFCPAEIRFYLHKEFRAAGIRLYLHKDCRAAGIRFYLHKGFRGLFEIFEWENGVYIKTFSRCAG